jgi:hypothetical protein
MLCTFIDTHCNYATCIMWSLKRSSRCYWLVVDCNGWVTCSWSRLMVSLLRRLLGVVLFTEALDGGCWSVKTDETREWVGPAWWGCLLFADLHLSLVTLRLSERAMRTALLEMYVLTGLWGIWLKRILRIALLMPWGGPKCRNRSQQFLCYYDCWLPQ